MTCYTTAYVGLLRFAGAGATPPAVNSQAAQTYVLLMFLVFIYLIRKINNGHYARNDFAK